MGRKHQQYISAKLSPMPGTCANHIFVWLPE